MRLVCVDIKPVLFTRCNGPVCFELEFEFCTPTLSVTLLPHRINIPCSRQPLFDPLATWIFIKITSTVS